MNWIKFSEKVPDKDVNILLSNGIAGLWIDDLYPDQAYLYCNCDCDYSESLEIENLIKNNIKWMPLELPDDESDSSAISEEDVEKFFAYITEKPKGNE